MTEPSMQLVPSTAVGAFCTVYQPRSLRPVVIHRTQPDPGSQPAIQLRARSALFSTPPNNYDDPNKDQNLNVVFMRPPRTFEPEFEPEMNAAELRLVFPYCPSTLEIQNSAGATVMASLS